MIEIPVQLVPEVRNAAIYMLGCAGSDIMGEVERADSDLQGPLERFDAFRALIDALPVESDAAAHVHVDQAHAAVIVDALREHIHATQGVTVTAAQEGHADLTRRYAVIWADLESFAATLDEQDKGGDA